MKESCIQGVAYECIWTQLLSRVNQVREKVVMITKTLTLYVGNSGCSLACTTASSRTRALTLVGENLPEVLG